MHLKIISLTAYDFFLNITETGTHMEGLFIRNFVLKNKQNL